MNYIQNLQLISKYSGTIYNDGAQYWSGDEHLQTPERAAMIRSDIALLNEQVSIILAALPIPK